MEVGVNDGVVDGSASGFGEDRRYCDCGENTEKRHNSTSSIGAAIGIAHRRFNFLLGLYSAFEK